MQSPPGQTLTVHPPDLDLPVVSSRHDERHAGVKGRPVDPAVMTLHTGGTNSDLSPSNLSLPLRAKSWRRPECEGTTDEQLSPGQW